MATAYWGHSDSKTSRAGDQDCCVTAGKFWMKIDCFFFDDCDDCDPACNHIHSCQQVTRRHNDTKSMGESNKKTLCTDLHLRSRCRVVWLSDLRQDEGCSYLIFRCSAVHSLMLAFFAGAVQSLGEAVAGLSGVYPNGSWRHDSDGMSHCVALDASKYACEA